MSVRGWDERRREGWGEGRAGVEEGFVLFWYLCKLDMLEIILICFVWFLLHFVLYQSLSPLSLLPSPRLSAIGVIPFSLSPSISIVSLFYFSSSPYCFPLPNPKK